MIHEPRLHLSLVSADRVVAHQEPPHRLTPEQAAILSLLDRVKALEREIAGLRDG